MTLKWILCGAIAGINGAACMSVLRLAARRVGMLEKMPPQAVVDWSAWGAGIRAPRGAVERHIADNLVHLGIGALGGAGYGALAPLARAAPVTSGLAYGFAFWAFGFMVIMPLLGITRPPWRSRASENVVNIATHLVFGAATGLVTEELSRQPRRATAPHWRAVRTG